MLDIVQWLEGNEKKAADVYGQAAENWRDDKTLSAFLYELQEDELSHAEMMRGIARLISAEQTPIRSDIELVPGTRAQAEAPFQDLADRIAAGGMTKKQLIEGIARIEFGEWNEIFLYFVNLFKERTPELQSGAAGMQSHLERIEYFISELPSDLRPSMDVATLEKVWETKYLVVDDNPAVREFLTDLLMRKGVAYAAGNGVEGLALLRRHFFHAVVTDIEMPVINNIQFYEEAVAEDPRRKGRFIFITFALAADRARFLRDEGAPCLMKPFDPRALVALAQRVAKTTADKL